MGETGRRGWEGEKTERLLAPSQEDGRVEYPDLGFRRNTMTALWKMDKRARVEASFFSK